MNKFVFTSSPESSQMAFNEIKKYNANSKLISYINAGVGIVETSETFSEISAILKNEISVFVRHICPINKSFDIYNQKDVLEALNAIEEFFVQNIKKEDITFSVQTRIYGTNELDIKKNFINETLAEKLVEQKFNLNIKNPTEIISIIITDSAMFFGISNPTDNLSFWAGGEYRFKKHEHVISRAEFKLLEAIDTFNIDIKKYKTALDLGASPGGWTKVLLGNGLKVTCVDPANLSDKISKNKNVTHHKCLAQDFLKSDYEFDIIVNDMRMDIYESIDLMKSACKYLKNDSIAIMTLKLREKNIQTQVNKAIKAISSHYKVLHAKQLFHNRAEVTLILLPFKD